MVQVLANVTHDKRADFEEFATSQGSRNPWITEPNGMNTKAVNRSSYLPVLYATAGPSFPALYANLMSSLDMRALA